MQIIQRFNKNQLLLPAHWGSSVFGNALIRTIPTQDQTYMQRKLQQDQSGYLTNYKQPAVIEADMNEQQQ